jgi:hypothetical protein
MKFYTKLKAGDKKKNAWLEGEGIRFVSPHTT